MAGAFDNLNGIKRSSFFAGDDENDSTSFIEKLIKYGNKIQNEGQSMQQSLFGDFIPIQCSCFSLNRTMWNLVSIANQVFLYW
jgi:hypothetical protein